MKAFKTYESAPLESRPPAIPLDWIWLHLDIDESKTQEYVSSGFMVLNDSEFISYIEQRQSAYDAWANSFDISGKLEELRIYKYVQKEFIKFHPSKIDFRRHLLPNIYFQKDVVISPNGRPQKALYYYEGIIIAEIEFKFETNEFNFMKRRVELLSYYKGNDERSEQWIIADDLYDIKNPYHLREMMKERSEARSLILEEVKAFLNGVLANFYIPQGKSYIEVLSLAGEFWSVYSNNINSWINIGDSKLSDNLISDASFLFLNVEISPGITVRDFILDKISY